MNAARFTLAIASALALAPIAGCDKKVPEPTGDPVHTAAPPPAESAAPEPADLTKEDIVVGKGPEAKVGDEVKVHYTGRLLKNNVEFDSSVGGEPFKFTIGNGEVIKGWDQGVAGMRVGGKRKLTIPSKLAYGDGGSPPKIPGKATLVFDIELLAIGPFPIEDDTVHDVGADGGADKAGSAKGSTDKKAKDPKKDKDAKKDGVKETQ